MKSSSVTIVPSSKHNNISLKWHTKDISKDLEDVRARHPNMLKIEKDCNSFLELYQIKDTTYRIQLYAPDLPSLTRMHGSVFVELDSVQYSSVPEHFKSLSDFLDALKKELSHHYTQNKSRYKKSFIFDSFAPLLDQLSIFKSKSYKITMSSDLRRIRFSNFIGYPNHFFELETTENFEFKVINHSLPNLRLANGDMFKCQKSIASVIAVFNNYLLQLEEFYTNMHTIDELCFVVEPLEADTKSSSRMFRLNQNVFLKIQVDPLSPSSVTVQLIGPSFEVEGLRMMYNDRIQDWDISLDVHKNLLRIFDLMYFPIKNSNDHEDGYCTICYSYRLNNRIPIVVCDNQKCSLIFHVICLKQWFLALKENKSFLEVTMGACPGCQTKLSTSLVEFLETT